MTFFDIRRISYKHLYEKRRIWRFLTNQCLQMAKDDMNDRKKPDMTDNNFGLTSTIAALEQVTAMAKEVLSNVLVAQQRQQLTIDSHNEGEGMDMVAPELASALIETSESNSMSEFTNTEPQLAPWDLVEKNARTKGLNFPMDAELYAKMHWITENVPKMSFQKIVKIATEEYVDRLIVDLYRP
ncbi:hypothetical protein ACO0LF_09680 [Undibacterium sp. Di27W]|uniref:hypothetical protein n=1 Tax=Undibacterium sp. Di27W TaxID=3413036 RepID=UPI003BF133D8